LRHRRASPRPCATTSSSSATTTTPAEQEQQRAQKRALVALIADTRVALAPMALYRLLEYAGTALDLARLSSVLALADDGEGGIPTNNTPFPTPTPTAVRAAANRARAHAEAALPTPRHNLTTPLGPCTCTLGL
jgi:hypothetical protein